ncbi:uncharacterized protein LOC117611459 [Osmia lignaria lignaria]|uniref:uncharacterized protein LOC117611459 n=1 Tax=Osmia lignaria lignaria TaxID=1437193 RepID=UPI00147881EB|nr:uncharacterized protein LOC117611459 [Osmia lignaria]XP_034195309.1 uncharacterized protein LOC117611459 [Osmia lignaria]XP_034195314.1 uncharacterized protein LOC117611459 [Osmia lignaria]XP_034195317.1 uncharacterized protein LOC117611459 [Osmia lignaria]
MEVKHLKIDKHLFEKALRRKSDETVQVLEIKNNPISDIGLNFLSDLFEVSVRYTVTSKKEKTKSERSTDVFIKIEPLNDVPRDLVRQQDLFLIELKVLRDVLPKIKQLMSCQLGPHLWYGSDNPPVLMMEDLKNRGFIMKNRQKGLSFEHCNLAIQQIAKLHAGSVAVFEKDPETIEFFRNGGIVSPKCPTSYLRLMEVSLIRISNEIRNWEDKKCANAADKLIKVAETIGTRCIDAYKYDPDEFCVLNHGDCWINNMMFKENEKGEPTDLLLVDYQMAVYTSPVIDLIYFLNICPEFSVKYDNDDYFLKIYLNTLKETMRSIGCKTKPPTMQQLKDALHKRRIYAVFSGIVLYLRMMANKEDTEDFTVVLKKLSGETKMDVFRNPDAVKLAHKMIPVMNERGYFD